MSNVTKLQTDIATLNSTVQGAVNSSQKLYDDLASVDNVLRLSDQINNDLTKLNSDINVVIKLLDVAALVPEITEEVRGLEKGLKALQEPISLAQKSIKAFDDTIAPARKVLEDFMAKLKAFNDKLVELQKDIQTFSDELGNTEKCINALPDGDTKTQLFQALESFAAECDPYVMKVNQSISTVAGTFNDVATYIEKELKPFEATLLSLQEAIGNLSNELDQLMSPLQKLAKALDQSFTLSIPYWCPTWTNPKKMCHYNITVSMDIIVKGYNAIVDYLEKTLGKAVWAALKLFGLDKAVKWLIDQGQQSINWILKQLNLNIITDIPGLKKLADELSSIEKTLSDLKDKLAIALDPVENLIKQVEAEFQQVDKIYTECKDVVK